LFASPHKWFLLAALLLSVVGAASPALGGLASCHCPDSQTPWIPTCCASGTAAPNPVAVENSTTPVPTDSGHRSATDGLVIPPEETGDISSIPHTAGSVPPGVPLFTLHASFLI